MDEMLHMVMPLPTKCSSCLNSCRSYKSGISNSFVFCKTFIDLNALQTESKHNCRKKLIYVNTNIFSGIAKYFLMKKECLNEQ